MRRHTDEIADLVKLGRVRNALLMAKTLDKELQAAARRVMRLTDPGTVVNERGEHQGIVQAGSRDDAQDELNAATAQGRFPLRSRLVVASGTRRKDLG